MTHFFENLFFQPKWYHYIVGLLLLPFSLLYGVTLFLRRVLAKREDFALPVISIGNIIIGGSGKTPFAITLIEYLEKKGYKNIFYISRGYGRRTKGLYIVKYNGDIDCSVECSGDEALLVAHETNANVIVAEDRVKAILKAKDLGADLLVLDDAFSKVKIEKFEIVLEPQRVANFLPLPSGPFREFAFMKSAADLVLKEGVDFKRKVNYENLTERMLLVTAISNPRRLKRYLPKGVVAEYCLPDHAYFNREQIIDKMEENRASSLLVTQKDYVKLEQFKFPLSLIKLKLELDFQRLNGLEKYLKEKECNQR